MPRVNSLSVSGYKSIRELKDFKLNALNVLIGANGAGKSNFIGFFRLIGQILGEQLQRSVGLGGGPDALLHFGRKTTDKLTATIDFGNFPYSFELIPTSDNKMMFDHELVWAKRSEVGEVSTSSSGYFETQAHKYHETGQFHGLDIDQLLRVYHFHDTSDTAKVKRIQAVNDNLRLKPDAANLAPYLRFLNETHAAEYRRIVETIRLVMPFFGDFVHRPGNPEHVELEWTQKGKPDTPFKAHMLSDGSLRFICLATLLLQPVALLPDTILIDEPELGLHPYAIAVLVDIFKQVAEDKQLIVSTQSVELVNGLSPEDIIVVDQEDGASTFRRYTEDELSGWLAEYSMGEIWKRNILGGRP
ncbi:MAG: AAA family ATPase [Pseudomonadota bacterium]